MKDEVSSHGCCPDSDEDLDSNVAASDEDSGGDHAHIPCSKTCCALIGITSTFSFLRLSSSEPFFLAESKTPLSFVSDSIKPPPRS